MLNSRSVRVGFVLDRGAHEQVFFPKYFGYPMSIIIPTVISFIRAGWPRGHSLSPGRVKNFLHVVQTDSGSHPASYPMNIGGSFPGG
jgi:hypothetical protein